MNAVTLKLSYIGLKQTISTHTLHIRLDWEVCPVITHCDGKIYYNQFSVLMVECRVLP